MKEIKIMGRADFACDVALWIFFIMYIYVPFRTYIYIYHHYHFMGLFDYYSLVAFPRVGYGRALIYLRVVRDASSSGESFPLLDSPVVLGVRA